MYVYTMMYAYIQMSIFFPRDAHWASITTLTHPRRTASSNLCLAVLLQPHLIMASRVRDVTSLKQVKELFFLRSVSLAFPPPAGFHTPQACRMFSTLGLSRGFLHGWRKMTVPLSSSIKSPPICKIEKLNSICIFLNFKKKYNKNFHLFILLCHVFHFILPADSKTILHFHRTKTGSESPSPP